MENNKKQTAVQSLFIYLNKKYPELFSVITAEGSEFFSDFHKYLEMEKEQILKTCKDVDSTDFWSKYESFEQYYNENYKK